MDLREAFAHSGWKVKCIGRDANEASLVRNNMVDLEHSKSGLQTELELEHSKTRFDLDRLHPYSSVKQVDLLHNVFEF